MKNPALKFGTPTFPWFGHLSFTDYDVMTMIGLSLLFVTFAVSLIVPALATVFMEVGFPLFAIWLLYRKNKDTFDPSVCFPAFYLAWCWVGTIPIVETNFIVRFNDFQWFCYLLGFIALWCGTLTFRDETANPKKFRGMIVEWNESRFFLWMLAISIIVILAWLSITVSEGIPILKADVEIIRVELPTRHRIAYQLLILLSNVIVPVACFYQWTAKRPKYRKTMFGLCVFLILALLSQGNRGLIFSACLTVFLLWNYLRKPWPVKYLIIASVIMVPILSATGYYRSLQHFGPGFAVDMAASGIPYQMQPFAAVYFYIRAPLDTFRSAAVLIPSTTPFQQGALTFGFLAQLLPGRHPSQDFFFKNLLGERFHGFGSPASILGTFYGDFGLPGIAVGMYLTGLASRLIYIRMFRSPLAWLLVYCYFWQKLIGSLYGSLFTYIFEPLVPIVWLLVIGSLAGRIKYPALQRNLN